MDPVSQGLVGAAVPGSVSNKNELRLAVLVGFLSGLLADIDVLIRSSHDPLLSIDYHRHFTHSLIIIPLGGLVAAGILWIFLRRRLGFGKIYIYATLGYATHALLDACTNYGTSLLWPFSEMKVAWNIVSVIDPVFTLTLAVLLIYSAFKKIHICNKNVTGVRPPLPFARLLSEGKGGGLYLERRRRAGAHG